MEEAWRYTIQYIFILYLYIYARRYNFNFLWKLVSRLDFLPRSVFQDAEFHKMVSLFCTSFVCEFPTILFTVDTYFFIFVQSIFIIIFNIYILMIFVE